MSFALYALHTFNITRTVSFKSGKVKDVDANLREIIHYYIYIYIYIYI
jgi:hypothetical protein